MSEAQSEMLEMTNTQENGSLSQGLPMILVDVVTQSIKEFRSMCKSKAKDIIVPPRTKSPEKKGKKMKNPVVAEKKVSFCLPENCDTGSFKDVDKVMPKLGDWKMQSRIRETRMRDTYYFHTSSTQTFRSISEVVNYILPDSYPKFQSRKRLRKGQDDVKTLEKLNKKPSPSMDSENAEDKEENIDSKNILEETLQAPQDVVAYVAQGVETHDEVSVDIEEDHAHVEEEPQTHNEAMIEVDEDHPHMEQEPKTHDEEISKVKEDPPIVKQESQTHDEEITEVKEDHPHMEQEPKTHEEIIEIEEDCSHVEQESQTHDEVIIRVEEEQKPQTYDKAMIDKVENRPHVREIKEPMFISANHELPQYEGLEKDICRFIDTNEDCPQYEHLDDMPQDFDIFANFLFDYYDNC